MGNLAAASRYSKALLELCVEQNNVDSVLGDMKFFQEVSEGSRDFDLLIHSPVVRSDKKILIFEKVFDQLLNFIDSNVDAKILQRANDVTTFMHKSFTDLDIITKNMISQKSEIFIHPSFKPLTLNVKKALDIVNKFEMTPTAGGMTTAAP